MIKPKKTRNDLITLINTSPALGTAGCKAELAGLRAVKLTRNDRFQGLWRQTIASYDWYPAGYNLPAYKATTIDDAIRFTVDRFGAPIAA